MAIFAFSAATTPEDDGLRPDPTVTTRTTVKEDLTPAPTPPTAATTVPVPTGDAELLAALRLAPENDPGTYDRDLFDYPGGGLDPRGCSTRERVLERDSLIPVTVSPGCLIAAGRWIDSYTGTTYENPADVSIDHVVALKEAYASGASSWSPATMVAFANDIDRREALRVIGGSGNASKGEKDPAEWMPPLAPAAPEYARAWLTVKVAYGLAADPAEVDALRAALITQAPVQPVLAPPVVQTTPAPTAPPTTPPPPTTKAPATTRAPASTATTSSAVRVVTAGAFCSPGGATGVTSTGKPMVCTTTAQDSRNRWRAA
jgi:hypothetical protein